jgi:hypothetical protein
VWACNNNQDWLWVDGVVKRQLMSDNVDDLFKLCQKWKPQEVGVEISGQQKGFISWIQSEMMRRNIYFTLASDNNGGEAGMRPNTNKMERFNIVVPWFKLKKVKFPTELKESFEVQEALTELRLANKGGFKAKNDDFIDTISMLGSLRPWYPSEEANFVEKGNQGMWDLEEVKQSESRLGSYVD